MSTIIPWSRTSSTSLLSSSSSSSLSSEPDPTIHFSRALVPISPHLFATEPFDIFRELKLSSRDKYANPERTSEISLYLVPSVIKASMIRIRELVDSPSKPSISITLSCCAANGIATLTKNPDIKELVSLRRQFAELGNVDSADFDEVLSWFDEFSVLLPESEKRQLNIYPPDWLKMAVSSLADSLGLSHGLLFLLSVMSTLVAQSNILDGHRDEMQKTVNKFLRRVALRAQIGPKILEIIDRDKHDTTT